jgi:hypothetical protein
MSCEIVGGLILTKKLTNKFKRLYCKIASEHVNFSLAHMTWCWQVIVFYWFSVIRVTRCNGKRVLTLVSGREFLLKKIQCHVTVFFVKNRPADRFVTMVARICKLCDRLV